MVRVADDDDHIENSIRKKLEKRKYYIIYYNIAAVYNAHQVSLLTLDSKSERKLFLSALMLYIIIISLEIIII